MSFDLYLAAVYATTLVSAGVLAIGSARAFQFARHFVNRTYRQRAYWGSLLMFVIMLGTLEYFVNLPNTPAGVLLSNLPWAAILLLLLGFLDKGIFVAMDGDIFHRDILHWRSLRVAAYVALGASVPVQAAAYEWAVLYPGAAGTMLFQALTYQNLVVGMIVFSYAVAAIAIGRGRTSDHTMKKHIKLLGIGFAFFLVSFPFFGSSALYFLMANTLIIFANTFLYLSVMSLSSVGKVEKDLGPLASATAAAPAGTH